MFGIDIELPRQRKRDQSDLGKSLHSCLSWAQISKLEHKALLVILNRKEGREVMAFFKMALIVFLSLWPVDYRAAAEGQQ